MTTCKQSESILKFFNTFNSKFFWVFLWKYQDTWRIRFVHLWCSFCWTKGIFMAQEVHYYPIFPWGKKIFFENMSRGLFENFRWGVFNPSFLIFSLPQLIQSMMMIHSWEKFFKNSSPNGKKILGDLRFPSIFFSCWKKNVH